MSVEPHNLVTHAEACAEFDLELKRLRGWIYRGFTSFTHPAGDETHVDRKSLERFLKRRADPFTASLTGDT